MNEKRCYQCKASHPLEAFNRDRSQKDGYDMLCRLHRRESQARYRERHPDQERNRAARRRATIALLPPLIAKGAIVGMAGLRYRVEHVTDTQVRLSNGAWVTPSQLHG